MMTHPKSVSFEEYRDSSWQDAYDRFESEDSLSRRFQGSTSEELAELPPPLEPRECIIPSIDPVSADLRVIPNWWKAKLLMSTLSPSPITSSRGHSQTAHQLSNNYIMPSSLAPVSLCSTPRSDTYFIPPPTAFRDDLAQDNQKKHGEPPPFTSLDAEERYEENLELIEIKRPDMLLQKLESDSGLASALNKQRVRSGLFDLPEVYSPPPLRIAEILPPRITEPTSTRFAEPPPPLRVAEPHRFPEPMPPPIQVPEPKSPRFVEPPPPPVPQQQPRPQMDGMMPSFVDHNRSNSHQPQVHESPRLINSEPILRSGRQQDEYEKFRAQHSSNNTLKAKTPFAFVSSNDKPRDHQHPMMNPSFSQDSYFSATPTSSTQVPPFHQKFNEPSHTNSQSEGGRDILQEPSSTKPESRQVLRVDKVEGSNNKGGPDDFGGSGDKDAMLLSSIKLSHHNCLSPRARPNPLLQPTVITSAMTEPILLECVANLKSQKWEDNFDAFSQIYNLTEIHPNQVKNMLNKIIWQGLPHLSSPRTKLARMACICFKRLYQTQKRSMEIEGEKVFYRLLDLCGGIANSFIQQESREALVAAVENLDPLKSVSFLELHGGRHKNPHVREFSAYLLNAIMDELPPNRLMNKDFAPRIIPMIVAFLREGLLQTRSALCA